MFRAFADRINIVHRSAHRIIDTDSLTGANAGIHRKACVGADSGGNDQGVAIENTTAAELYLANVMFTNGGPYTAIKQYLNAEFLNVRLQ